MTMYVRKPLAQANRKIQFYAEFSIIFALKGVYGISWGGRGGGRERLPPKLSVQGV